MNSAALWAVFITGLLAGGVSCAVVQGGLLLAVISRQNTSAPDVQPHTRRSDPQSEMQPKSVPDPVGLGADLVPVSGFIVGKLVSHTMLGFLLGWLGSLIFIDYRISGWLQIVAGLFMLVMAAAQLRVPGFSRFVITPPQRLTTVVRATTRSRSAVAPAVLGLATVLIPCGVTLSVEFLAATSGSPVAGAVIMFVFVLGTSPLFVVLGVIARRSAVHLRGVLAVAVGVAVLGIALVTINGGLAVVGSPLTVGTFTASMRGRPAEPPLGAHPLTVSTATNSSATNSAASADSATDETAAPDRATVQNLRIDLSSGHYEPNLVTAKAGIATNLIMHTQDNTGCGTYLLVPSRNVHQLLPATGDTTVALGVLAPGTVKFMCGMGMINGEITVT